MTNCLLCGYPMIEFYPGDSACKKCADEWLASEQAREESYQQAREERAARAQADYEEWRAARYEQRCRELEEQRQRVDAYREAQLQKGAR